MFHKSFAMKKGSSKSCIMVVDQNNQKDWMTIIRYKLAYLAFKNYTIWNLPKNMMQLFLQ